MKEHGAKGVRVFLVDDHPAMRSGLSMLLAHVGCVVCGEAEDRAGLLERADGARADVTIVDLSLADENGLDLLDVLRERGAPALVYSMHENWSAIEQAFDRGAMGYVTKREGPGVLLEALVRIKAGERYLSPRASRGLAGRILEKGARSDAALSAREEEIMEMLGRGETNGEIAGKLNISASTVQTYYARIMEKLDLPGMKELRKAAITRRK